MNNRRNKKSNKGEDEVEELLKAAQDELVLKLSVDSHMSRVAPDHLFPDLDRRFQALKSRPSLSSAANIPNLNPPQPPPNSDDLISRFAALKASSSTATVNAGFHPDSDADDEEDEVEKIIRWAKDAARLDPSPPSNENSDISDGEDEGDFKNSHPK